MKRRKLYHLLQSLSPKEFRRVGMAVHSPFFNTNPSVVKLFEAIKGKYPKFKISDREMENIYADMFPGEKYNDGKLRRLFTFLKRVVEDCMAYMEMERVPIKKNKLLAQSYEQRNLTALFFSATDQLIKELDKRPWQNASYFFEKLQLEQAKYFHPQHNKYDLKDNTLEDLMDDVDAYFAFAKIQMGIALKNKALILNKPYHLRFLEMVDGEQEGFMDGNVLFELYQLSLHLLEERKGVDFERYQALLFEHIDLLEEADQQILYFNGLNYAIRQWNKGFKTFSSKILNWYKFGLKEDFLLKNKIINEGVFSNIVNHGAIEKEFVWTLNFVKKYSVNLREGVREEEIKSNMALLNFYQKNYENVILYASQNSLSNKYFLRNRNILIRTYFERFLKDKNGFENLENELNNFESLLYKKSRFSAKTIEPHLNLIQVLKGLSLRIMNHTAEVQLKGWLKNQLNKRTVIISKNWLEELLVK